MQFAIACCGLFFFSFYLNLFQESNGPSDAYAAISNADRLQAEPESLRKWREEQRERLEVLGNVQYIRRFVLDLNNSDFFFFYPYVLPLRFPYPVLEHTLSLLLSPQIKILASRKQSGRRKPRWSWKIGTPGRMSSWRRPKPITGTAFAALSYQDVGRLVYLLTYTCIYNVPAFAHPRKVFLWFWCLFKANC